MEPPNTPDALGRELRGWRVTPARNSTFRPEVWARIRAQAAPASWGGYVRRHAPAVAGALALAVAVGAFTGREQAQARVAAARAEIATAYVQGMDARLMRMP